MRGGRARATAVGLSLAAHVALLAAMLISRPSLQHPTAQFSPDVVVTLPPPSPRLRPPVQAKRPPTQDAARRPSPTSVRRDIQPNATARSQPTVQTPSPAVPAAVAPTTPTSGVGDAWRVGSGVGMGLWAGGGLGCGQSAYARMTTAQQAACDRRIADLRSAQTPHLDLIPALKRAYYDAVAKAYAMRKAGTPLPFVVAGPGTNLVAGERWAGPPGAHPPGFGCKIPLGVPKGWKAPSHGPPHSLKLGFLPCYITPPAGFLTEEADIPSAVDIPKS